MACRPPCRRLRRQWRVRTSAGQSPPAPLSLLLFFLSLLARGSPLPRGHEHPPRGGRCRLASPPAPCHRRPPLPASSAAWPRHCRLLRAASHHPPYCPYVPSLLRGTAQERAELPTSWVFPAPLGFSAPQLPQWPPTRPKVGFPSST